VDHDSDPKTPARWRYRLTGNAGCNRMSGRYWLKDGHLTWSRRLSTTKKYCPEPVDRWLKRTLQQGVSARMVKGQLILTRKKRGIRITLSRVVPNSDSDEVANDPPTTHSLLGWRYRSIRVNGNRKVGNRQLKLDFFMHSTSPNLAEKPTMVFSGGCNAMGSKFRVRGGRLSTFGSFSGTARGCGVNPDPWLIKQFRKGLKIRVRDNRLILTRPNAGVRFVLRQTGPTRFG